MTKDRSRSLAIVQPYLTEYRRPVYDELAEDYEVTVLCDTANADFGDCAGDVGFRVHPIKMHQLFGGRLLRQPGVIRYLVSQRPQRVFCFGNPRNLTFWSILWICRLLGLQCFVHTQGPYKHQPPSLFQRITYFCIAVLCHRCIGYAPISAQAMTAILPRFLHRKIRFAENSYPIPAISMTNRANSQHILFIGRLRPGCGIELLLEAMRLVWQTYPQAVLDVVGGGELAGLMQPPPSGIVYHGTVYEHDAIAEIAGKCVLGVYPGDAGLSVLHYLALGLPVVVHDDITRHMGPEPSFIEFGKTGFGFTRDDRSSLAAAIEQALGQPARLAEMGAAARAAYDKLSNPSLAKRFAVILAEP